MAAKGIYSVDQMEFTVPYNIGDSTETVSQPDSQQLAPLLHLLSGTFPSQVQEDPIEPSTQSFHPGTHLQPEGQPIRWSAQERCDERQSTSPCTVFTDEPDVGAGGCSSSDMCGFADESVGENRKGASLDNRKDTTPLRKGRVRSRRLSGSVHETYVTTKTPPLLKRSPLTTTRHSPLFDDEDGEKEGITATEVAVNDDFEIGKPHLHSSVITWSDDFCPMVTKKHVANGVKFSSANSEEQEDNGGGNESFGCVNGDGESKPFVAGCEQHGGTGDEKKEHSSTLLTDSSCFRRPRSPKPVTQVPQAATDQQRRPVSLTEIHPDVCVPRPVRANAISGPLRKSTQLPHPVKRARFPNAVPSDVFIRGLGGN